MGTDASAVWDAIVKAGSDRGALAPILAQMRVESLDAGRLRVRCPERGYAMAQRFAAAIGELANAAVGTTVVLDIRPMTVDPSAAESGIAVGGAGTPAAAGPSPAQMAREDPVVKRAVELFGARITRVSPRRKKSGGGGGN